MLSATYSKNPYWERTVLMAVNQEEEFTTTIQEKNRSKIVLLSKGTISITYQKGKISIIAAPAMILINEKEFPEIVVKDEVTAMSLYFHPSVLNDALDYELLRDNNIEKKLTSTTLQDAVLLYPILQVQEYATKRPWILLSHQALVKTMYLLERIKEELEQQKDGYWPCRSRSYFIELLILITKLSDQSESLSQDEIGAEENPELRSVLEYIQMNFADHLTLNQLAMKTLMNRNSLTKLFWEKLSITPMQYVISVRLKFACSLLSDTDLPISEVGIRSGFYDLSHFGRTFKNHMNCSPMEYRKQHA